MTRLAPGGVARRRTLSRVNRRSIVDYALQRRALLADVYAGRVGTFEVCDAHPYLQRAAKYHGEASEATCPVCRKERLIHVHYVYGDRLGHVSGQAKSPKELPRLASAHGEFTVYVVEVCRTCGWNHLALSYVLGHGGEAAGADEGRQAARK
jgi:hypothetical protein